MDGGSMGRQRWHHSLAQSTETSTALPDPTARHCNWIPNLCNSTNSATSTDSASTTQESDKKGKPVRATADNPNITLMPPVIKMIPKLAFELCTDSEQAQWELKNCISVVWEKSAQRTEGRNVLQIQISPKYFHYSNTATVPFLDWYHNAQSIQSYTKYNTKAPVSTLENMAVFWKI